MPLLTGGGRDNPLLAAGSPDALMTGVSIRCVSHCKLVSWPRASSASVSTCRCSARIRCSTITRPTVHVTVTAVLKRSPDPTITNASIQPPNQPPRALWRLSLGSANCGREFRESGPRS